MDSLQYLVKHSFQGNTTSSCWNFYQHNEGDIDKGSRYMTVPIKGDKIEIPVLAFRSFVNIVKNIPDDELPDNLVIELNSLGKRCRYKALTARLKGIMSSNFTSCHLVKVNNDEEDKEEAEMTEYYASEWSLFNDRFAPLMMFTWQFKCQQDIDDNGMKMTRYRFLKPVMRITPTLFTLKYDKVGRFVCKTLLSEVLNTSIETQYYNSHFDAFAPFISTSLIVDYMPFRITPVAPPNINTTNEQLLKTVVDNLEDVY